MDECVMVADRLSWLLPLLVECDRLCDRVRTLERCLEERDRYVQQLERDLYGKLSLETPKHKEPVP